MRWTQYSLFYAIFILCTYGLAGPISSARGSIQSHVLENCSTSTRLPCSTEEGPAGKRSVFLLARSRPRSRLVKPSSSGSKAKVSKSKAGPKIKSSQLGPKPKKVPSPDAFSKTKRLTTDALRGSKYREKAIKLTGLPKSKFNNHAADHVLELQAVAHHINKYRTEDNHQTHQSKKCVAALRKELNNPTQNIVLVNEKVNSSKGFATTAHLNGAHLNGEVSPHFTPKVQDYILKNKNNMHNTAKKVDQILVGDMCGKLPPGMVEHVNGMVKSAEDLKQSRLTSHR